MARLPGPRNPIELAASGLAMLRRPHQAVLELHRRYGPVCQVGVWPYRYVFLFGAEANEYLLSKNTENFRWREAIAPLLAVVDGDTALVVTDGDEHRRRRKIVQPAFHTRKINAHLDVMLEEANRTIDTWQPGRTVDAYADFRAAVRRIVIRALFGERLRDRADELGDRLQPAIDFTNRSPLLQVKVDLPGTAWHRAKRARARTDELVFEEIAARQAAARHDGDDGGDILGMLLDSELTDQELRDQVVSLIAAGYDTTSAAVGWAMRAVLANEGVWDRAKAEIDAAEPTTAEDLNKLPYLDGIVSETLRLWPPGFVSARYAVDAFDFAGHRIPGKRMIIYSAYVTQRMPELWPDPERFDPDRWRDGPPPYSWVPFGGGYRRCIGFALATLEMKAILLQLLRRTELELLSSDDEPAGLSSMYPKRGVPVRVMATC